VSRSAAPSQVLRELSTQIASCARCADLAQARQHTVPGQFPAQARLLLVGEGPGADEDARGEPFVGRSGQLLDAMLVQAGLVRSQVAVANVVKCRPPGNRAPKAAEVAACRPFLHQQLDAAAPMLIVALGGTATQWFFGRTARLTALRGSVHDLGDRQVMATYHPSAALRFGPRGEPACALQEDLRFAAQWLDAITSPERA
jgi:uracil-DNA glycosylase family 4